MRAQPRLWPNPYARHSDTENNEYMTLKEFISQGEKVLIIDDFLANGKALIGLMDILGQAGAETVGCCSVIEKGFQGGGDLLRAKGIRVESLAIIDDMADGTISFR